MRHQGGIEGHDGAVEFYTGLWKEIRRDWEVKSKGWAAAGRVGRGAEDDEESYRHWMTTLRGLVREVEKGSDRSGGLKSGSSAPRMILTMFRMPWMKERLSQIPIPRAEGASPRQSPDIGTIQHLSSPLLPQLSSRTLRTTSHHLATMPPFTFRRITHHRKVRHYQHYRFTVDDH